MGAPEQRFRNVFQKAPIGVALPGLAGGFLEANRSLCQLLGYSELTTVQATTYPQDVNGMLAGTRQSSWATLRELPRHSIEALLGLILKRWTRSTA